MDQFIAQQLSGLPFWLKALYPWKDVIVGVLAPAIAALIVIWQVRKTIAANRGLTFEKQEQEQYGILRALNAELSAFLYYQIDAFIKLSDLGDTELPPPPLKTLFLENAGRAGSTTGRAFGILTIYYNRLDNLVRDMKPPTRPKDELERGLLLSIGHGSLIRAVLQEAAQGKVAGQLTKVSGPDFEKSLDGFSNEEKTLIRNARQAWLAEYRSSGRS